MRYIIFKTPSYFENRAKEMMKKFPYNPRKCTSVSSLSGCIHRYLSKAIISLPTQAEFVDVFEKTRWFHLLNIRLAFYSNILFPSSVDGSRRN